MQGGHWLRETVVLEHVQKRGLTGVVQAEEHQLAALFVQTCAKNRKNLSDIL